MSLIVKSYLEEICWLLGVTFFGICSIILCISFSSDYEEQECVKFYIKNNYITDSCEIYRDKLEEIKNEI